MTRKDLIKTIYDNDDTWSCPKSIECKKLNKASVDVCMKCAEKQLAEYETEIKDKGVQQAIDSALDFLWGVCIQVDQREFERYIKIMVEKKGFEV